MLNSCDKSTRSAIEYALLLAINKDERYVRTSDGRVLFPEPAIRYYGLTLCHLLKNANLSSEFAVVKEKGNVEQGDNYCLISYYSSPEMVNIDKWKKQFWKLPFELSQTDTEELFPNIAVMFDMDTVEADILSSFIVHREFPDLREMLILFSQLRKGIVVFSVYNARTTLYLRVNKDEKTDSMIFILGSKPESKPTYSVLDYKSFLSTYEEQILDFFSVIPEEVNMCMYREGVFLCALAEHDSVSARMTVNNFINTLRAQEWEPKDSFYFNGRGAYTLSKRGVEAEVDYKISDKSVIVMSCERKQEI